MVEGTAKNNIWWNNRQQYLPYWYDHVKPYYDYIKDFTLYGYGIRCTFVRRSSIIPHTGIATELYKINSPEDYEYGSKAYHTIDPRPGQYFHPDYELSINLGPCRNVNKGMIAIKFDNVDYSALDSLVSELPDRKVPLFAEPLPPLIDYKNDKKKIELSYDRLPPGEYYKDEVNTTRKKYHLGEYNLSTLLFKSKQVITDARRYPPSSFAILLCYRKNEFPGGTIPTRLLAEPTPPDNLGVSVLCDNSAIPIDPGSGVRLYTQLPTHQLRYDENPDFQYTFLDSAGIITLDRTSLEEVFRAIQRWGVENHRRLNCTRTVSFGGGK